MARKATSDSEQPSLVSDPAEPSERKPRERRKKNAPVVMQRHPTTLRRRGKVATEAAPEAAADEATDGATAEGGKDLPADLPADLPPDIAADVEGQGVAPIVPEGRDSDFLLTYFKDLTRLSLLSPAAEYELARRIGIMEEVLWVQVLSFSPMVAHILSIVEQDTGKTLPEWKAVQEAANQVPPDGKHTSKELADAAGPAAAKLRQLDLDRLFITSVLEEVKAIDAALKAGQPHEALATPMVAQAWHIYVQGISVISQLIQRAKDEFVKANLRLVVSIARRFNYGRMPLADLIQEGNVGLIKAVERFDYRRGFRFSTYAAWWIRHAISRGLADKGRVVRLPIHTLAEFHTTMRAKRTLTRELGRAPTHEELAQSTGLRLDKIQKMDHTLLEDAISLDREVSDKDHRSFMDFLQDEEAPMSVSERLISDAMLSEVQRLLGQLSAMEADILRLRFGLDSDQELTLKEIGDKYSLSRERIRQIQEMALSRMRRALSRKDLI
jgi:RNA polymerase primary sigma factor